MIYFEIRNKQRRVIASNISSCPVDIVGLCRDHKKTNIWINENIRHVYRENEKGEVRLIILDDKDLANSKKGIARIADAYLSLISPLKIIEKEQRSRFDQIIKRFAHNLVDLDKQLKGILYRLAPDSIREKTYAEMVENVKSRIEKDTNATAKDICQITHSAYDLEAQITSLRVISGIAEEIGPSFINVNIYRTIYRLQQPYIEDLSKKKVSIINNINPAEAEKFKVRVDPQLLNVAISQFLNNAVKYTLPDSTVILSADFDSDECVIKIEMVSIYVEDDERDKIFFERYKGKNAQSVDGSGIGMFLIKSAFKIMGGNIKLISAGESFTFNSIPYSKNTFLIYLKKAK